MFPILPVRAARRVPVSARPAKIFPCLESIFHPSNRISQNVQIGVRFTDYRERFAFAPWINPDDDLLLVPGARFKAQPDTPNTVEPKRRGSVLSYPPTCS